MDKESINKLQGLLGAEEAKSSKMVMAPDMGGDFKSDGFSLSKGNLSANLGEYSTNAGKNYYGYAGYQPLSVGQAKIGGDLKAVIAPGGKLMISFDKRF